ncbi:MAG: hypothetical protein ACOYL6_16085 [Bacteriovoracaceae bacterium]
MKYHLLLLWFFPTLILAADFSIMDQRQKQLAQNFEKTFSSAGSPDELLHLIKSGEQEKTKLALQNIEAFEKSYDAFTLDKLDLFMETSLKEVQSYYQQMRPELKKRQKKKFDERMIEIEDYYRVYGENKNNMGLSIDSVRTLSGRKFFRGIGTFVKDMRNMNGEKVTRIWGAPPVMQVIKEMAPVTDDILKAIYAVYFKARRNGVNEVPIIDSLRNVAKRMAEVNETQTEWLGLQNFEPMPLDGETVNLLVFMHANSYLDTSVQGTLELPGLSSIGNVDLVFPPAIAKRFDKSDHVVCVGRGDMIKKTVDIVRSKRLNKFFIAAEGLTPIGFYEMRPIIDIFGKSVYALKRKGLKVNIYPVSFPDNFRMMNEFRTPIEGNKLAYGIVHKPIKDDEVEAILKASGNEQSIAHYIRWVWFSDLINNADRDMSMPRPSQLKEWLDGMVWGNL